MVYHCDSKLPHQLYRSGKNLKLSCFHSHFISCKHFTVTLYGGPAAVVWNSISCICHQKWLTVCFQIWTKNILIS